ncbi:MAG: sugar-binding domain-containing protein [Verrucomicrobiota bacterium]
MSELRSGCPTIDRVKDCREQVVLDGTWDLVFDPNDIGKRKRWFEDLPRPVKKIAVPGVIELVQPKYDGVAWYQTTFEGVERWKGRRIRLGFGAAQYYAECWLNGRRLGAHEGGHTPFEFDISQVVRHGENRLVVRIINPPMDREIEGFRCGAPLNQSNIPVGKAGWYYNFGGLWQGVSLTVTERTFIQDVYVQPLPFQNKADFQVTIHHDGPAGTYELAGCVIPWKGGPDANPVAAKNIKVRLKKGDNIVTVSMRFKKFRFWSVEDPFLYVAQFTLLGKAQPIDSTQVRFGMREFTISRGRFLLNGRPVVMKGFLGQGMYPRTLIFPETPAMARKELRLIKDHGFNFLRTHLQPPPPYYLDLADEMGILILGEPAIGWIINTPPTEGRCRRAIEEMMARDRNHPSIIMWCLLNEAFHFLGFSIPQVIDLTARLARQARAIDSTRLMINTSGGYYIGEPAKDAKKKSKAQPVPEGMAAIMLPNSTRMENFLDIHAYCKLPASEKALITYRSRDAHGMALFVSEYGAPETPPNFRRVLQGYTPKERRLGLEDYQLHKDFFESLCHGFSQARLADTFGTVDRLIEEANRKRADDMRLVTSAMRVNANLGGLCFCQLADASGELFGATDVWREPKPMFHALVSAVRTPLLVPFVTPRLVEAGKRVQVDARLVNETQRGPTYSYKVEITRDNRSLERCAQGTVRARAAVQTVFNGKSKSPLPAGRYNIRTTLTGANRLHHVDKMEFAVIDVGQCHVPRVAIKDPKATLKQALTGLGVETDLYGNNYRNKNIPILMDLREKYPDRALITEDFGQLKKIVQLGGCAILFEPECLLLYEALFPWLLRHEPVLTTFSYIRKHPIFAGLPVNTVSDFVYADVEPDKFDRGADVVAAGGEVLWGVFSMHRWTRPANYFWGAGLYLLPLGRGHIIVSQLRILNSVQESPVARRILVNLINYAGNVIRPGGEAKLLSRCIDPLSQAELRNL